MDVADRFSFSSNNVFCHITGKEDELPEFAKHDNCCFYAASTATTETTSRLSHSLSLSKHQVSFPQYFIDLF